MCKRLALVVLSLILLRGSAVPRVFADQTFHTERIPLMPVGGAPLQAGFVVDVHANGPRIYAQERYVVVGATPSTTYTVQTLLYPHTAPSCSGPLLATLPDAALPTNVAGNGEAAHTITPAQIPPSFRGTTVDLVWQVLRGPTVAYQTGCVAVALD